MSCALAALEAHTGLSSGARFYFGSNRHLWNYPPSCNCLLAEQECHLKVGDATLLKALREFSFFFFFLPIEGSDLLKKKNSLFVTLKSLHGFPLLHE